MISFFWFLCCVDLQTDASILKKRTVSIVWDEVAMLGSRGIYVRSEEGKAE